MKKHTPNNERIKRKYLTFLKQAKGQNEASLDTVAKAIARFEEYNQYKDFKAFHFQQAIHFKAHLGKQKHHKTGKALSLATLHGATRHLKAFFQWLSQEVGYKSRIKYSDAEYFNISEKEARTAKAKRQKPIATIEQIQHTLSLMPNETTIQKRNKALIAFTILTGARDSAIASFKIKHIDFVTDSVYQDAREVKTKFSKTFHTYFFPVGGGICTIVEDWVTYLKQELLFGNEDPLFPKTQVEQNKAANFQAKGVVNEHWSSAAAIRKIFKVAFTAADLPTFNPHSFRNTLAALGETICRSPEEFKAWSQNLGHEGVLTTFYSYGDVQISRQADLFKQFKEPRVDTSVNDVAGLAKALAMEMANQRH